MKTMITSCGTALLLATLAACGGNDDNGGGVAAAAPDVTPAAAGSEVDPCTLLTLDDVTAAFGSGFGPGESSHQEEVGTYLCMWSGAEGMTAKSFGISVTVEDELPAAFDEIADFYEQTKALADVDEELELGDDAYRAGTSLVVLEGDRFYEFSTFTGTSDEAIAGLHTVAAEVIKA